MDTLTLLFCGSSNTVAWAAFSFFAGLGLGHWLTLGRDKRKERNEVALRLKATFEAGRVSYDKADWMMYLHLSGPWHRRACQHALREYEAASSDVEADSVGQRHFRDPARVKAAIARLAALVTLA